MKRLPVDLTDSSALMVEIERRRRALHVDRLAAIASGRPTQPPAQPAPAAIPAQRAAPACPTCWRSYVKP